VCGENLFAKHSVEYTDLESYFMGFSVWDERNVCLSWEDTLEWFGVIGITPVRVMFEGTFDEKVIKNLSKTMDLTKSEGYVVRNAGEFHYDTFSSNVAKYVRKNHVQSEKHWTQELVIVRNGVV
jgi:hypothetical protein